MIKIEFVKLKRYILIGFYMNIIIDKKNLNWTIFNLNWCLKKLGAQELILLPVSMCLELLRRVMWNMLLLVLGFMLLWLGKEKKLFLRLKKLGCFMIRRIQFNLELEIFWLFI